MIETIEFNGVKYPKFQTDGNASRFCMPFALEVCKGAGLDIGCNRPEWAFPDAIMVDPALNEFDAYNLPDGSFDFIYSSHCAEHLDDWVGALDIWIDALKFKGTLFLYLPDFSQEYWRPHNNRKHKSVFTPEIIRSYLESKKDLTNIFVSGVDAYNSFISFAEKV